MIPARRGATAPLRAQVCECEPVRPGSSDHPAGRSSRLHSVVHIGSLALPGELTRVSDARGLVIVADGSGRGRHDVRTRGVVEILQGYGLDTLLFDLLSETEGADRAQAPDTALLGQRLVMTLQWSRAEGMLARLGVGLYGDGTAAAAALNAAARHPGWVNCLVSRSGRTDLAQPWLARVQAPTLLVVAGNDTEGLPLNRAALRALRCEARLEVVPGATPLFDEPGAIETVAHLAGSWFVSHLPPRGQC